MKNSKLIIYLFLAGFQFLTACEKDEIKVATGEATHILTTTAEVKGILLSIGNGIKFYGHCYAKTPGPTTLDPRTEYTGAIGVGEYTSFLQGLEPGTTYYVKAYISRYSTVVYGEEISFTTAKVAGPGSSAINGSK